MEYSYTIIPEKTYSVSNGPKTPSKAIVIENTKHVKLDNIIAGHDSVIYKTFEEAKCYLQHLGNKDRPKFIIAALETTTTDSLTSFAQFLYEHESIIGIPFILLVPENTTIAPLSVNPIIGVDDIIRDNISETNFEKKIQFLRKYKSLKQQELKEKFAVKELIPLDRRAIYKIDQVFKRLIDILIAGVALILLSPLFLIIAVIIKIDSKGPVFYTSFRAGSNYRVFKFIKFRTMSFEADNKLLKLKENNQYGSTKKNTPFFFKISNDPRVTRSGKFLRNTSLDELPQLLNVLIGDMSLVGNRPLPLYEAKTLTTDFHAERFNAPAGITGLWQISKRGHKNMSIEERIALDITYARNNSLINDIHIMLKTPKALIQKDNV